VRVIARPKPLFLSAWLRHPLQTGALIPSSHGLSAAMARQIDPGAGLVVELGAGTGAVTMALRAAGLRSAQLVVVEKNRVLADALAQRFPMLQVMQGDAGRLRDLLRVDGRAIGTVVSSLPLLSMRALTRTRVLAQVFEVLGPGGKLVQFTYSPRPPVPQALADGLGIRGERVERVLWNLPPASVWVYRRLQWQH
jgi:phosphatidylethanolamine/phosphatidyl-N-methylethanolamine N-methyltransferase